MRIIGKRTVGSLRHRRVFRFTVGLIFFLQAAATHAVAFLYAVDEVDTGIHLIETATGVEVGPRILRVSGVTSINRFDSVLGAAIDPLSGMMYAVIDLKNKDTGVVTRKFVTIDPRSGVATDITTTDPDIDGDIPTSGLAFDSVGTLYSVTADSELYTINLGTGVFTFVMALGNGLDGETIAFNPDDGRLYHSSGMGVNGADKVFESIDLNTLAISNIPLSGDTDVGLQTLALVYDAAQSLFLGFRNDGGQGAGEYFSVTSTGVETLIGAMPTSTKSLAFHDPDTVYPPVSGFGKRESHVYALDRDGPYLSQLDATTGAEIDLIGITLPGITLQGGSGLAMNPLNGDLYATVVVLGERSNHRLVRLDPRTGVATLIGLTGQNISGLTFATDGTLYAVSADENATFPSWLFTVRTTDAFASALLALNTASTPGDGEIIAFNSNDGLLYHASGSFESLIIETIDLTTFGRSPLMLSDGVVFGISALVYEPLNDRFMGTNANGSIFSMTPGGSVNSIQPVRPIPLKGFGVITPPAKGDMNGDRKSDILWRHALTGRNVVHLMDGAAVNSNALVSTISDLQYEIAGDGDYNGDGKADILWRHAVTGRNVMHLMDGATILSNVWVSTISDPQWQVVGNGDYNGDGKADILWRHAATGRNVMHLMDGATIISNVWVSTIADLQWQVVGNGDYNGDGRADILWRHALTGRNVVHLMDGTTILSNAWVSTISDLQWQVAGNGDYNGDGKADILWRHGLSGRNVVHLMDGANILSNAWVSTISDLQWQVVGSGDYNGDAKADILWRHGLSGRNVVHLMNGAAILSNAWINTDGDQQWQIVNVD